MSRQQSNFEIMAILENYLTRYPDIRFGQALYILNLATHRVRNGGLKPEDYLDIFSEEPETTLSKIRQT